MRGGVPIYESVTDDKQSLEGFIWNKVWKRSTIGMHRFRTDISMCEDSLFTWETLKDAKKAAFIDLPMYHYMIWKTSSTRTASLSKNLGALRVYQAIYADAKNISQKCVSAIGKQNIIWILLTFRSLIPVYKDNKEIYRQLKDDCKLYKKYMAEMSGKQRVQLQAIEKNYYLGAAVTQIGQLAKIILK